MTRIFWTDAQIEKLRRLWDEGATANQISAEMGHVGKNAVLGKAHRLGLPPRENPVPASEALPSAVVRKLYMRLQKLGLSGGSFDGIMEAFAFTETGTPEQIARALGIPQARIDAAIARKAAEYGWQAA
jgi:hypothetical protein